MKILIICAMDKELQLLHPLVDAEGKIGSHEVRLVRCGIGKVNAAISARAMIDEFSPELVINSGVAGGLGHGAGILDVVVAERVAYYDVWCGPGTVHGQADGCPLCFEAPAMVLDKMPEGARKGLIVSGDTFISKASEVEVISKLWPDALAVDMESAAIAQVCYMQHVPFVAVRVVSDTPGQAENISQYNDFWTQAPEATFHAVKSLLNSL